MQQRVRNILWKAVNGLPVRRRLLARTWMMRLGIYRYDPEWYALSSLGPNRGTALDVGANRGYYSLALARLYDRVIAFEPNGMVTHELIALRHPRIDFRSEAVSDSDGTAKLFLPRSAKGEILDGWASFDRENLPGRAGEEPVDVRTLRLDSLGLDGVTFVKMDVEGHEVSALRGAAKFLRQNRPTMLIEVRPSTIGEVESLLAAVGLREKKIGPDRDANTTDDMRLFVPA